MIALHDVAVLLLLSAFVFSCDEQPVCSYQALATQDAPSPEFRPQGACATKRAGEIAIHSSHLAALDFAEGPAALLIGTDWYYATSEGRAVAVLSFDNGPDYFVEGLARTKVSGRVGYIDRDLRTVIPARFDFGWPFEQGTALVCMECTLSPSDSDGHTSVVDGRWGYIDKTGVAVVPIRLTREAALAERPPGPGSLE